MQTPPDSGSADLFGPLESSVTAPRKARRGEASIPEKEEAKRRAWKKHPDILQNSHQVFLGDARAMSAFVPDSGIHLVVTSPPYWDLKEYGTDHAGAQLGHIANREEFLTELDRVWRHCFDRLVAGGKMCVVVGDVCRSRRRFGRHTVEPLHAYIQVRCQTIGFDPLATIFWAKIANAATEVGGNGAGFLGKPYEPNAVLKNDVEYILVFRKPGDYRHPTQEQRDLSLIDKEDHRRWFQQIWTDIAGASQREHPAPYPPEIARRLIGMYSFVGDTVLDPFWGLGNTTLAAMAMHRSSIGIEIEPKYYNLGATRFWVVPPDSTIKFITDIWSPAGNGAKP